MSLTIDLRNVGIIREAHLEFVSGLNLILGSSSSGKSTLLRSLRSFVENSFTDSNVTFGQTSMAIRILDGEHTYVYMRDLNSRDRKAQYQIDGNTYTKVGRNPLEELQNTLRLSSFEIDNESVNFNFSSQFAGPFLLLGSPSLLYSILTYRDSFDITRMTDLYSKDLKKVKSDMSVASKLKTKLESEQEAITESLKCLKGIDVIYEQLHTIKSIDRKIESLKSILVKIDELKRRMTNTQVRIAKADTALQHLQMILTLGSQVLNISPKLESIKSLKSDAKFLNRKIAVANKVCAFDLQSMEKSYKDKEKITEWIKLSKQREKTETLVKSLKEFSSELRDISNMLELSNKLHIRNLISKKISNLQNVTYSEVHSLEDLIRVRKLFREQNACSIIVNQLQDTSSCVTKIQNLSDLRSQFIVASSVKETLSDMKNELLSLQEDMNAFKICPLCEQTIPHKH